MNTASVLAGIGERHVFEDNIRRHVFWQFQSTRLVDELWCGINDAEVAVGEQQTFLHVRQRAENAIERATNPQQRAGQKEVFIERD